MTTPEPGSLRAAFAVRDFRIMWTGSFLSTIGTWMQQVVMGSFVYKLTKSTGHPSTYVAILFLANNAPMMCFAMIAGDLADRFNRRKWLTLLQSEQAVASILLAVAVWTIPRPSIPLLFFLTLAVGLGNAFNAPAWTATLPQLVPREDLGGAIAAQSSMINGTRVIGPAIAGILYPILGAGWIFFLNALTYLFVIGALQRVDLRRFVTSNRPFGQGFFDGVRLARSNKLVGQSLRFIPLFSFFCLPFLGLFAPISEGHLGLDSKSPGYGWLYAVFGLGAVAGTVTLGTIFTRVDKGRLVRPFLAGFIVSLILFALVTSPGPAYPVLFALGFCYFPTTTAMVTVLQRQITDQVRGRVMALWFMGFGGTVPFGSLLFGSILDRHGARVVLLSGAVAASILWLITDLRPTKS